MHTPDRPPLALIAGPTASGKSALALSLADRTGGTIINADASQVYSDLRIITARPSPQDETRAPHRLFGHVDAACPQSAASWALEARHVIASVHGTGGLPIIVGGTGLYLRILLDGIAPIPEIDPAVRSAVRQLPAPDAYAALECEDPNAAGRLRHTDTSRIFRALEVVRSTGRTMIEWQQEKSGGISQTIGLAPVILVPDTQHLATRIDQRFDAMLKSGAIEEVDALLARDLDPTLPAMRAIGVSEIAAWRTGSINRAEMIARATSASRRYAKRQRTWFRHQTPTNWPVISQSYDETWYELDRLFPNLPLTR